jgi:phage tail-like protein
MIERIRKLTISGPEVDRVFELPEGPTLIGRQPGVDLLLPGNLVSRQHAKIECEAERSQITDLESSNGTRLNGETLQPKVPMALENGALIEIGPYRLVFEVLELEISTAEATGEEQAPVEQKSKEEPEPPEHEDHLVPIEAASNGGRKPPPNGGLPVGLIPAGSLEPPPGLEIHSQRLISYLPGIFQGDFMQRFLGIFESILTPIEWNIDNFDLFLDPGTAPYDFMPWLANWYVLTFDSTWNEAKRRLLMAEAHKIYARRGTPWALSRVLEIYTGEKPLIDDQSQDQEPHTFRVTLPIASELVNVDLVKALINANKPAYTSYSLHFANDK